MMCCTGRMMMMCCTGHITVLHGTHDDVMYGPHDDEVLHGAALLCCNELHSTA